MTAIGVPLTVRLEQQGAVLWVSLDRPEARNALDMETLEELANVWHSVNGDPTVRVAVLTASGEKAFCAGADLKKYPQQSLERARRGLSAPDCITASYFVEKPLICAINGDALGGGLELALACDFRITADHARMGLTEARWGVMPAGGGTQRLPQIISPGHALQMMMCAEPISAAEALRIGLVTQVVPLQELRAAASALAEKLTAKSPEAIRAIKRAFYTQFRHAIDEGLRLERQLALELLAGSADAAAGLAAFASPERPRSNR